MGVLYLGAVDSLWAFGQERDYCITERLCGSSRVKVGL